MMHFSQDSLVASLAHLGVMRAGTIFEQLTEQYQAPTRVYHNHQHIEECLYRFQSLREQAERPAEIEVAIWFHDAIYDSRQSDNEEKSALWARTYLENQGVPKCVIERINEMIIATKTHQATTQDAKILLDIDLGILGASDAIFDAYDQAIRQEYRWVAADIYEASRQQVLTSFLSRERIYYTACMFEQYESQARRNLIRRIKG